MHRGLRERLESLPIVWLLGRPTGLRGDIVQADDLRVGQIAAEHLVSRGHRAARLHQREAFARDACSASRGVFVFCGTGRRRGAIVRRPRRRLDVSIAGDRASRTSSRPCRPLVERASAADGHLCAGRQHGRDDGAGFNGSRRADRSRHQPDVVQQRTFVADGRASDADDDRRPRRGDRRANDRSTCLADDACRKSPPSTSV